MGKGKALFVSDGFYYYAYTVSLMLDRDLDFSNQYQFNRGRGNPAFAYIVPETGRPANQYGIGLGLLWLPAFAATHLVALMLKALGLPLSASGYELYYELPTYLWSFLLGLAGMYLLYRLLTELFEHRYAFWATIGIMFGTALSNYAFLHANMSHWVSAACSVAYLYAVYRVYRQPSDVHWWLISGAALGLAAMVRYQNAALGVLLVGLLWQLLREQKWRNLVVGLTAHVFAAVAIFLPQIFAWQVIYGESITNPYGSYVRWLTPNFSYIAWLYAYSPLLLLATWGFFRQFPPTVPMTFLVSVTLALLVQLYVNCALPEVGGYGVRRMTDFFPYFGVALANALRVLDELVKKQISPITTFSAVGVNWLLIAGFYLRQLLSGGRFHF